MSLLIAMMRFSTPVQSAPDEARSLSFAIQCLWIAIQSEWDQVVSASSAFKSE